MAKKWKSMANVHQVNIATIDWDPSVTQPDETLSIRQILHRVSQGLSTGLYDQTSGEYDEDDDEDFQDPTLDPEFDNLDALAIATSEHAEELRNEDRDRQEKARQKRKKDEFDKAVDEEIKRRQSKPEPQESTTLSTP